MTGPSARFANRRPSAYAAPSKANDRSDPSMQGQGKFSATRHDHGVINCRRSGSTCRHFALLQRTRHRLHVDRAQVRREAGCHSGGYAAGQARLDATKAAATCLPTRCSCHRALAATNRSGHRAARPTRRRGHLLLGRVWVSCRHRAWQDVGTSRPDPSRAPSRAQAIGLGCFCSQLARSVLVLRLPRCARCRLTPQDCGVTLPRDG